MKKIFLSLLVFCLYAMNLFAQNSCVATLCHGDSVSTCFYGYSALKNAYEKATSGDVIVLSEGLFDAVKIDKSLIIRGAGGEINEKSLGTIINGKLYPEHRKITLEGLFFRDGVLVNGGDVTMNKCYASSISDGNSGYSSIITVSNSYVKSMDFFYTGSQGSVYNSIVVTPSCSSSASAEFVNSFIGSYSSSVHASTFQNCVIVGGKSSLGSSNMAYHCLAVADADAKCFEYIENKTNYSVKDYSVFSGFNGKISPESDLTLTKEAAKAYVGNDGTQVGIYGGRLPYSLVMKNPRILKFDVASETDNEGLLKVDVKVGVAQ